MNVPSDATHYFLWWDGIHIYKKDGKKWYWFIRDEWVEPPLKIKWFFGWHQIACGYTHKLHRITYEH